MYSSTAITTHPLRILKDVTISAFWRKCRFTFSCSSYGEIRVTLHPPLLSSFFMLVQLSTSEWCRSLCSGRRHVYVPRDQTSRLNETWSIPSCYALRLSETSAIRWNTKKFGLKIEFSPFKYKSQTNKKEDYQLDSISKNFLEVLFVYFSLVWEEVVE